MTAPPTPEAATKAVFAKHAVCLVLDYGSQYTQLIARRVREAGVLSVLLPGDASMVRAGGSVSEGGQGVRGSGISLIYSGRDWTLCGVEYNYMLNMIHLFFNCFDRESSAGL